MIPSERTALLPTERERELARSVGGYAKTQHTVANLLARYRVELVGLDGKSDPRVTRARDLFQEIQELAAGAAAEMRPK